MMCRLKKKKNQQQRILNKIEPVVGADPPVRAVVSFARCSASNKYIFFCILSQSFLTILGIICFGVVAPLFSSAVLQQYRILPAVS
jgi:hypothetical protein